MSRMANFETSLPSEKNSCRFICSGKENALPDETKEKI